MGISWWLAKKMKIWKDVGARLAYVGLFMLNYLLVYRFILWRSEAPFKPVGAPLSFRMHLLGALVFGPTAGPMSLIGNRLIELGGYWVDFVGPLIFLGQKALLLLAAWFTTRGMESKSWRVLMILAFYVLIGSPSATWWYP